MYIYHAPTNALSTHMTHINLNTIFYTYIEHSPTKSLDMKYYTETHTHNTVAASYTYYQYHIAAPYEPYKKANHGNSQRLEKEKENK